MGFKVVEVQPTPNPNAQKFIVEPPISDRPISFFNAGAAKGHPLAEALFAISGVSSLLLLGDFVTVNKQPAARWPAVTAKVKAVLAAAEPAKPT